MATTNQSFVKVTSAGLIGSTVQAAGAVVALNRDNATQVVNGGSGTFIDRLTVDLATAGFAKNGAAAIPLTGTTPVNIDLTDLTAGATVPAAGDTGFSTVNQVVIRNTGAADVTLSPGGSNPANFPKFSGTTPTITIPAGSEFSLRTAAGATVDSTHKILTVTPTSGGSVTIAVGGA